MIDPFGRKIDYIRFSLTDRCNLRCRYCMPEGVQLLEHQDILSYEELLTVAKTCVELGITHFKITGGEPLVRRGCPDFLEQLKSLPGVDTVTLTTNGILLEPMLPELKRIGIDGINISLDTLDREQYARIAGMDRLETVLNSIRSCAAEGLKTKLNCVLLTENERQLVPLVEFADSLGADIRFIELMPIGAGEKSSGPGWDMVLALLREHWPELHPVEEKRGFGPARYYAGEGLKIRVGTIAAVSHMFCSECNRIRLTSTGRLKPCLCYGDSVDLRPILRSGGEGLRAAMEAAISQKPASHRFYEKNGVTERDSMNQIGG